MIMVVLGLMHLFALPLPAAAQDDTVGISNRFLRAAYQIGWVLPTNDFVKGDNARGEPVRGYNTGRLEFGWQTDGSEDWHHIYNYPSYGIGLNYGNYFEDEELGQPLSLYGFLGWPLTRWGKNTLSIDMGFGMTDNWLGFDEVYNPYNVAIATNRSIYIDVGATVTMPLSPHWDLRTGFSYTHYSNGGFQQPNWGINQIGPLVYLNYNFQEGRLPAVKRQLEPYVPNWQLATTFAMSVRNLVQDHLNSPDEVAVHTKDYLIANLNITASRRFSHKSRYGFGLDLEYDDSLQDLEDVDADIDGREPESLVFYEKLGLGVNAEYELVVARAELVIKLGYTVLRKDVEDRLPRLYQGLGVRYDVYRGFYLGANVRIHNFTWADNLEIGLTYKWGK